jgi:LPS export ABC transporter protein LptC
MITRKSRRGIIALVLLTAVSYWAARDGDHIAPEPVSGLDPKLNYVLRDFELQFYDNDGQATINMRAPILRNDPVLQMGTIESPVIRLNQPGLVWNLTAESATVTADKEHVQLSGQVHVRKLDTRDGSWVELDTSNVQIEVTPQTASTDQPVSMFDGYNQANAIGLELDMKSNTFKLKQQVKATYAVN